MDLIAGAQAFQILATHLKEAGETGLRRELNKGIRDGARPAIDVIKSNANLMEHMPDPYAVVFGRDLKVTTSIHVGGTRPGITILARAPTGASGGRGGRKIRQREDGILWHPVFAQGPRRTWRWREQTDGMKAGFFTEPAKRGAPEIRNAILEAMRRIADEITKRT